ncbi:MAG: hypothetical protein HGJ94_13995 [Desulfosarcina sp.]|nr:hypothetical protein [Desulfosarcina sp.]MBC2741557.1 hypothetical protein [Desulfosarcina sp.]MBC2764471.1 hypothetical protein [Desulfosarcina sp.]
MGDLVFDLSPTQLDFVMCEDQLVQIMSGMGEGKTFAGVAACIVHAQRCGKNIRGALIRDTFQNIKISTLPDIQEVLGRNWCRVSDQGKKLHILTSPGVELDLFGIDDEASISKLQGPQYAIIWLEEPAPILERANAGLPRDVLNMAIARASRQPGTVMRVQITQNPADEDHWTSKLSEEPDGEYSRYEDPDTGEVSAVMKKTFHIRPGENKYLPGMTRAANLAAFQDDPAKMARYVEGQIASVNRGKKVTPKYNPAIHYCSRILPVIKGELLTLWDGWHHPTCILAQYMPTGQLVIHDVVEDDGLTAVAELCPERLDPLLNTPKYRGKITSVRAIGDESMATPDQSTRNQSAAKVVVNYLEKKFRARGLTFERGPKSWTLRRESVNNSFSGLIGEGIPKVVLSRSAVGLHRALRGGWHYKTDNNGKVVGDKPVKDQYSHPGDAFGHGMSILMPYLPAMTGRKVSKEQGMKVARSYATGSYRRQRKAVGVV